ncbi:hypothetical protein V8B97DRAFT_2008821 [Scleroderma yunnanense]
MPNRVLLKAYQAKQVNHNCIAHHVTLTLAKHEGALAVTNAQLQLLAELLDDHGLSDVEDNGGYHHAVYMNKLVTLTIAKGQANQVKEVIDSWAHPIWPDPDNELLGKDEDNNVPFTGLLSSDDSIF